MLISELNVGDKVEGFFLLQEAAARQTANGKPFLNLTLEDRSGSVGGIIWNYAGPVSAGDVGAVVKLRGTVSEFRGALQVTADRLSLADASDEYPLEDLVPVAPIDADAVWQRVLDLVDSMSDPDYAAVCRTILEKFGTQLRTIPAAKRVHHSFLNGLLMHTSFMLEMADHMATLYGEIIDRSLLLAGTLLHDVAKSIEFSFSPLGLVTEYSTKGQLLGHLVMGAQEVAKAAETLGIPEEKSLLLQHLLLSHHGEPEFGAAVRPLCAEAELLSCLDTIDSRMEIYRETLSELPAGTFSGRIFSLDRRIYRHH